MSKIIDITDKLTFEENPRIRVKDVEIELNANALDFYETLGMMNEKSTNMDELTLRLAATPADVDKIKALKPIYEKVKKKVDELRRIFKDWWSKLNFNPLADSIDKVMDKIKPCRF